MRKYFFLVCLFLFSMGGWALTRGPIMLTRLEKPISPRPIGTLPRTLGMDQFSAVQNFDEIIITSELISGTVSVSIYDASGLVVETISEYVTVGEEISISLTSLPAGAYILEVSYDETIYVGQFEI